MSSKSLSLVWSWLFSVILSQHCLLAFDHTVQHKNIPVAKSDITQASLKEHGLTSEEIAVLGHQLNLNQELNLNKKLNPKVGLSLNTEQHLNRHLGASGGLNLNPEVHISKPLYLNIQSSLSPESHLKRPLTLNEGQNYATGLNLHQGNDQPSLPPLELYNYNKNNFQASSPIIPQHELENNFHLNLKKSLNDHQNNLHQGLVSNHQNLHQSLNSYKFHNSQNLNANNYQFQDMLPPMPALSNFPLSPDMNNYADMKPQIMNHNEFTSQSPYSSHGQSLKPSPVWNQGPNKILNNHDVPDSNNNKYGGPNKGVKTQTYSTSDYFYENHKVNSPMTPHTSDEFIGHHNKKNYGNNNPSYPETQNGEHHPGNGHYNNKNNYNQYNYGPSKHDYEENNKNQYNSEPQEYPGNNENYNPTNYGSNHQSYQNSYNDGPNKGYVTNNHSTAHSYSPNEYNKYSNNQETQGYGPPADYSYDKSPNKDGSSYNQDPSYNSYGDSPVPYKGNPSKSYSGNSKPDDKNSYNYPPNSEKYSNNNQKYYSHSSSPNSGKLYSPNTSSLNVNSPTPSTGNLNKYEKKSYSGKPQSYNGCCNEGHNYNSHYDTNEGYSHGNNKNEYHSSSPDERKRSHNPPHTHNKKGSLNKQGPSKENTKKQTAPNYSYPTGNTNKSPQVTTSESYSESYDENLHNAPNANSGNFNRMSNFKPNTRGNSNQYKERKGNPPKLPQPTKKVNSTKVLSKPLIHEIYMSDPLIKDSDFFHKELP